MVVLDERVFVPVLKLVADAIVTTVGPLRVGTGRDCKGDRR